MSQLFPPIFLHPRLLSRCYQKYEISRRTFHPYVINTSENLETTQCSKIEIIKSTNSRHMMKNITVIKIYLRRESVINCAGESATKLKLPDDYVLFNHNKASYTQKNTIEGTDKAVKSHLPGAGMKLDDFFSYNFLEEIFLNYQSNLIIFQKL